MSPEICAGRPFDLGSDLYAIACTLHEVLPASLQLAPKGPRAGRARRGRLPGGPAGLDAASPALPVLEPSGESVGLTAALGLLGFSALPFHEEHDLSSSPPSSRATGCCSVPRGSEEEGRSRAAPDRASVRRMSSRARSCAGRPWRLQWLDFQTGWPTRPCRSPE